MSNNYLVTFVNKPCVHRCDSFKPGTLIAITEYIKDNGGPRKINEKHLPAIVSRCGIVLYLEDGGWDNADETFGYELDKVTIEKVNTK